MFCVPSARFGRVWALRKATPEPCPQLLIDASVMKTKSKLERVDFWRHEILGR